MRLESGPARAERNYFVFFFLICAVVTALFIKDGAYGYLGENREAARKTLTGLWPGQLPRTFGERPTELDARRLETQKVSTIQEAQQILQAPVSFTRLDSANGQTISYFVGDYGMAEVRSLGAALQGPSTWKTWYKSKEEITAQYYWAAFPALFAVYAAVRAVRAITLRVVVDDEGIRYASRTIPWEQVLSLKDYNRKGWVDLYYGPVDRPQKLRLDNQKIARWSEVVQAICDKKGFVNPVPRPDAASAEAPSTATEPQ